MNKMTVKDLKDLKGKHVLVRCDFNVPMKDGTRCENHPLFAYGQTALHFLG